MQIGLLHNHNNMCDGNHCLHATGEVRLYPLGGGGNLILCYACFAVENQYRRTQGKWIGRPEEWPQVEWSTAEVYPSVDTSTL